MPRSTRCVFRSVSDVEIKAVASTMSTKKRSNTSANLKTPGPSNPGATPTTPTSTPITSSWTVLIAQIQAGIALLSLAVIVRAVEYDLPALYGGAVTRWYLQWTVSILPVLLAFLPSMRMKRISNASLLSSTLCAAPFIMHQLAVSAARAKHPLAGPMIAYVPVLVPATYWTLDLTRTLIVSAWPC